MEECIKDSPGVQYVRCLKCDKIIRSSRHDTSQLIEHIRNDHPEVTVVESGTQNSNVGSKLATAFSVASIAGGADGKPCSCPEKSAMRQSQSQGQGKQPSKPNSNQSKNRHLFRTSIERWRPANGTIYCPFCCCKKQPLVKMRNERLSGNSCTANCMLACWPLCFLPFLLPSSDKEYLYCANCKCFLGLYDKTHNCIRPNKQFSEKMKTAGIESK